MHGRYSVESVCERHCAPVEDLGNGMYTAKVRDFLELDAMRTLARVGVGESQRCGSAKGGRFPEYPTQELWELFVITLFPLFTKFPSIYSPGLPNRSTLFPRPPEYLHKNPPSCSRHRWIYRLPSLLRALWHQPSHSLLSPLVRIAGAALQSQPLGTRPADRPTWRLGGYGLYGYGRG